MQYYFLIISHFGGPKYPQGFNRLYCPNKIYVTYWKMVFYSYCEVVGIAVGLESI
jgi:hypothetical protein